MSIEATRDARTSARYFKFSEEPVGSTCEVRDGVIADFDSSGNLRGIEVTDPSVLTKNPLESLVHEANKAFKGVKTAPKVKIPEL